MSSPGDIFDLARQVGYDGPITFHCQKGEPLRVEIGKPVQIRIATTQVLTIPTEQVQSKGHM